MEIVQVEVELDSMGFEWTIFTWTHTKNNTVYFAKEACSLSFIEQSIERLLQRVQDEFDRC